MREQIQCMPGADICSIPNVLSMPEFIIFLVRVKFMRNRLSFTAGRAKNGKHAKGLADGWGGSKGLVEQIEGKQAKGQRKNAVNGNHVG